MPLNRLLQRCAITAVVASVGHARLVKAQAAETAADVPMAVFVGSATEDYLRVLQTLGVVPPYPWSVRGFSPAELQRSRPSHNQHPWVTRPEFQRPGKHGALQWEVIPLHLAVRYNSAFPYGPNDGPVWAGRGLTSSMQLGGAVRWGPLSLIVAPIAFRAENTEFELSPNGLTDTLRYADPNWPTLVDRPQRFGNTPYQRLDPGQTTLRIDWRGLAIGASTANLWVGPMIEYPYLLGNNAPGFPHVFAGSGRPVKIGIGRIHGRIFYGKLGQSEYTSISGSAARRFAAGIAAVFTPRGVPGLELGVARFVHAPWPDSGVSSADFRKLFEGILISRNPNSPTGFSEIDTTNQLGSVFVRWVLPRSGFEIYGEFGREDHGWDRRDLLLEIDHAASLGLGFRKAWLRPANGVLALRGEIIDFRLPVLWRHRGEVATYLHPVVRQGHTNRGQLLGAGIGMGSSQALTLELSHYSAAGGLRALWSSAVRRDGTAPDMPPDVQHIVGLEKSFFRRPLELAIGLGGTYEFNRDFQADARNYYGTFHVRWWPYVRGPLDRPGPATTQ